MVGRGACRHPDGVARLVRSALSVFAADAAAHAAGRPCEGRHAPSVLPFPRPASARRGGVVSSRVAVALRVRVDPVACDAYGYCAELLPERVSLDEWGYPVVDGRPLEPGLVEMARRAAAECPRRAFSWTGAPGGADRRPCARADVSRQTVPDGGRPPPDR